MICNCLYFEYVCLLYTGGDGQLGCRQQMQMVDASARPRQGDGDQKYCLQESGPALSRSAVDISWYQLISADSSDHERGGLVVQCCLVHGKHIGKNAALLEVENMYSLKTQKARQFISEAWTAWIFDIKSEAFGSQCSHASPLHLMLLLVFLVHLMWRCRSASLCCPSLCVPSKTSRCVMKPC